MKTLLNAFIKSNPLYYKTQFKETINIEIFHSSGKYINHGAGEEILSWNKKN